MIRSLGALFDVVIGLFEKESTILLLELGVLL